MEFASTVPFTVMTWQPLGDTNSVSFYSAIDKHIWKAICGPFY